MDLYILQWSGFFYLVYWICIFYNDLVSCISGVLYLVYWICIFYNDLVYCVWFIRFVYDFTMIWFPVSGLLDLYILQWTGVLYLVPCIWLIESVYFTMIWFPVFLVPCIWFIGSVYFTIIWLLESPAIFSNSL